MLHHPNVVQVYDFGEDNGVLFLALEYVEGPSLSRVLRTLRGANKRMPPAIVAFVAREICRALACVHELRDEKGRPLGAIHRDVTPSNVVLTPAGEVKLLDFGVATFKDALQATKAGTVKGKPAYLAPEQLEGKPIDGRVDLFALGIVMHEMLTLQHLFAGDSDLGTVKQIMEMDIPRPSANRNDVPEALERIVMRALERDRAKRFATAAEMACGARRLRGRVEAARRRRRQVRPRRRGGGAAAARDRVAGASCAAGGARACRGSKRDPGPAAPAGGCVATAAPRARVRSRGHASPSRSARRWRCWASARRSACVRRSAAGNADAARARANRRRCAR